MISLYSQDLSPPPCPRTGVLQKPSYPITITTNRPTLLPLPLPTPSTLTPANDDPSRYSIFLGTPFPECHLQWYRRKPLPCGQKNRGGVFRCRIRRCVLVSRRRLGTMFCNWSRQWHTLHRGRRPRPELFCSGTLARSSGVDGGT